MTEPSPSDVAPQAVEVLTNRLLRFAEAMMDRNAIPMAFPNREVGRYEAKSILDELLKTNEFVLASEVWMVPDEDAER